MGSEFRRDYLLAAVSAAWVCILVLIPPLTLSRLVFLATVSLITLNLVVSLRMLFGKGRVLVILNLAQLPLFCILNYQLFRAFGGDHYQFDVAPAAWHWIELTVVHIFRAVDVLDGLEAYGIDLQHIHSHSAVSGALLVWMHIAADIFIFSWAYQWFTRLWKRRAKRRQAEEAEGSRQQGERARHWAGALQRTRKVGLAICLLLMVACAAVQGWRRVDWLLWPLDNALRTVDVGDMFQIYHWQLHRVSMGFWTITLAMGLRLVAGVYLGELITTLRVVVLRGHGETVEQLITMLDSGSLDVRVAACEGLGSYGASAEAIPALSRALADAEYDVRLAASRALDRLDVDQGARVPGLIEALADEESRVRRAAASALGEIGPSAEAAVPTLIKALADKDRPVRQVAAATLDRLRVDRDGRLAGLVEALGDEDREVRQAAAESLGEIGPGAGPAAPALIETLGDQEEDVRLAAAKALQGIGPTAEAAVPALIVALADEKFEVRLAAARALGEMGPAAKAAVGPLSKALAEERYIMRLAAAGALGDIGPGAEAAAPTLGHALVRDKHDLRRRAAESLGQIGPGAEAAVPALIAALADEEYDVRREAARALGQIGPAAEGAVSALREAVADKERSVREAAAESLGKIG